MIVTYVTVLSMTLNVNTQPNPFCLCSAPEYSWWRSLAKQNLTLVLGVTFHRVACL